MTTTDCTGGTSNSDSHFVKSPKVVPMRGEEDSLVVPFEKPDRGTGRDCRTTLRLSFQINIYLRGSLKSETTIECQTKVLSSFQDKIIRSP